MREDLEASTSRRLARERAASGRGHDPCGNRAGAVLRHDHVSLDVQDGRPRAFDSGGKQIEAEEIVVTAGAWAAQILRPI